MQKPMKPAFGLLWAGAHLIMAQNATLALPSQPVRDVALSDPNLRFVGRWDKRDPAVYHSYWGSAYLHMNFTGASVGIKLAAATSLVVSIDGEPPRGVNAGEGVTFLDAATQPLLPGTHSLLVGSAGQNYEILLQGLQLDVGAKTLPVQARPLLEFIGDSITAFGGPEAKDDYRDGVHPTEAGGLKVTRRLAPLLKSLLTGQPKVSATVTVGDPHNPIRLVQDVQNAYNAGARNIIIRPGTYMLPNLGRTVFALDNWQNATISARGVTLMLSDLNWNHNLFELNHCSGVTIAGPTLTQSEITSYQGRVIAIGKDDAGQAYADWRPDKGYPVPPAEAKKFPSAINVVDGKTRRLKIGNGDFYDVPMQALGNGVYRLFKAGNFGVGDWLVGRYGNAPFKVLLQESRAYTIKDVTLQRNGFAPIREDGGGDNHIIGVKWALAPRPIGATEEPLISGAADGLHSTAAKPGPDIENCTFEGVILDDCLAIHGYFQKIKSVAGNTLIIENGAARLAVGNPARLSNEKGFFCEAMVVALKDNGDKTTTITLDKDLNVPAEAKISNPFFNGAGYKIIGCHIGGTRSRGVLLKGDNGLVKDNVFEGCGMAAISIGPEYYWNEADYSQHVVIEGNVFRGNGVSGWGGAAILVHGDGTMGNRDIVIKNNRMQANFLGEITVEWTDGVTLVNNAITGMTQRPALIAAPIPVTLANVRAVTLTNNVVHNAAVYKPTLVQVGTNVTGLTGNDPAGIRDEK